MALLVAFAVLAGAGTALTPCVLPVLPALLSASATGGRRRPLGVILGLTVTFVVAIIGIATVIDGVGLASGATRTVAIAFLLLFGLAMVWPRLAVVVERPFTRLARFGPSTSGSGFWSGVLVGAALGFLYAPCAGPILAAVISVAATGFATGEVVLVAIGYGIGSAAVLLALAYGGRRVVERIRGAGRGPGLQRALGAVMIVTAVAMATELDLRFQTVLANDLPSFIANPTGGLERSSAVEDRLADLRGAPKFDVKDHDQLAAAGDSRYPVLGVAPAFAGNGPWLNTPGGRPLKLSGLMGRVVLIDFWTYTCINCLRTLPHVRAWADRYEKDRLTVVGVHTPEFSFEKDTGNVRRAIARDRLHYPVLQDNDYDTWTAWGNQYWPAKYLIDGLGRVRYTHFGEGDYDATERAIRALLRETGRSSLGGYTRARGEVASAGTSTPETYLGYARAQGFVPRPPAPGVRRYDAPGSLPANGFALGGTWRAEKESATAVSGATVDVHFNARRVFLVLSSRGDSPRVGRVLLDGHPVTAGESGEDVRGGVLRVTGQRLYRLVSLPRVENRTLRLELPPGVTGYAFTFG
jgi:cytochrome c biogenesis protein CcdA/thiol-disulfide isomerase/thioredoxin